MQDLLNPKQKLFVAALVAGASLAQAAQKAGYAKASSGKTGGRLIREAAVSHALAQAQGRIAAAAALTADDIIAKLDRAYEAALAADPVQAHAAATCALGMAKIAGLVIDRSESTVMHKPSPLAGSAIELSEADWKRQFAPG
jgi:hypothetical protein